MVQFEKIGVADAFQRGQQNKLNRELTQQSIGRESSQAPIRNQLSKLGLRQVEREESNEIKSIEQKDAVQKMTILNNVVKSLSSMPEDQRGEAFLSIEPELLKFGINTSEIKSKGFSDGILRQAMAATQGFLQNPNKLNQVTGANKRIQEDTEILKGATDENGQLKPVNELTAQQRAAAIRQRLVPGAGMQTGKERIALDSNLTDKVATSQSKIRSSIKQAEVEAKATGDTLTDLNRAKAALPGLREVTNKLKILADAATFTTGGKIVDVLAKELFGVSTEGGTARTTMTSIVDNQVLPLLRETFGAAFTKAEGDSLRATLLDVDKTPDEKKATLDAFIEQKIRNIETKEREINPQSDELTPEEQAELEQLRQLKAQQG